MDTNHIFVPLLDFEELLPFGVKAPAKGKEIKDDGASKELISFIKGIEKRMSEKIIYVGFDVICEKSYERFMFSKGGFMEIMMEAPIALNAHFTNKKSAEKFAKALKLSLHDILPDNPVTRMFIESIAVRNENDTSLTVEKWHKIKEIRG